MSRIKVEDISIGDVYWEYRLGIERRVKMISTPERSYYTANGFFSPQWVWKGVDEKEGSEILYWVLEEEGYHMPHFYTEKLKNSSEYKDDRIL